MKKLSILFIIVLILNACSSEEEIQNDNFIGTWKLVQMKGSFANSETTGAEMEWQEDYVFKTDSTFTKTRERENKITVLTGTYSLLFEPDGRYLTLTYPDQSEILANCSSEPVEVLFFSTSNVLKGTYEACDGSGLKYKKVK